MADFRAKFLSKPRRKFRSMMGLKSNMVGVGRGDMLFLEHMIASMEQVSVIVELGTFGGVTSMFLGMAARLRGVPFCTFDIQDVRVPEVKSAWLNDMMYFYQTDILSKPSEYVTQLISNPYTFLFVDNGDKEKEANMYASYCGPNTVMVIHDWGDEVKQENVEPELLKCGFKMQHEDVAKELQSVCRCYIKGAE